METRQKQYENEIELHGNEVERIWKRGKCVWKRGRNNSETE